MTIVYFVLCIIVVLQVEETYVTLFYSMRFYNVFPSDVQPFDKARNAVALALSPVVRALVDPDGAMRNIRDLDNVCVLSLP